ncbi:MAG: ATP-dependent DNA ligase, partial [Acidobacteria bacterium]
MVRQLSARLLVSIAIVPAVISVPVGVPQPFTATGTYTDGSRQDLTQSGHWSSTSANVATISDASGSQGVATTLIAGTTTIGISSGSVSASATLTVLPAALVSISINPAMPTIPLGTNQQFTAAGSYTDGSSQDLTSVVTWTSSDAGIAVISDGLASSSGVGAAKITATLNTISNSTT